MKKLAIASLALLLGGCASTPPVSDLRSGVRSATFIQYGSEPLAYKLGVVDTGSFWAQYGGGVSGGFALVVAGEAAAAAGRADAEKKAPEGERALKSLYQKHPMVNEVGRSVMPQLAQLWDVPYSPSQLRVVQPTTAPIEDEQGNLKGISAKTDLILLYSMTTLALTEKQTVGRAFTAGFTMGSNTKMVAADTYVVLRAYKPDGAGGYRKVWSTLCTGPAMQSKVDYPFPEVMQSREKAKEIFDAAVPVTTESCSRVLQAQAKS
jgi:hypothetical protein